MKIFPKASNPPPAFDRTTPDATRAEAQRVVAADLVHELNNVLGPIVMSVDLLKLRSSDPEVQELLETIEQSTREGKALVKKLQSWERSASMPSQA